MLSSSDVVQEDFIVGNLPCSSYPIHYLRVETISVCVMVGGGINRDESRLVDSAAD